MHVQRLICTRTHTIIGNPSLHSLAELVEFDLTNYFSGWRAEEVCMHGNCVESLSATSPTASNVSILSDRL